MPSFGSAVALVVREVKRTASVNLAAAMTTADLVNGHRFQNDGRTFLRVKNVGGGVCTVTIDTPGTIDGLAVADNTFTVPITTGDVIFGPFSGFYNQPGTSEVWAQFSSAVTVDAFHLSNE